MLDVIQAGKEIRLSNIARSLQENIELIQTVDRLSRNLSKEDFSDHINEEVIRLADDKITDDMAISIDLGDIMKHYTKAMLPRVTKSGKENLWGAWDCQLR
jgi:hypothetical protein